MLHRARFRPKHIFALLIAALTLAATGCTTLHERSIDRDFPGIATASAAKPIVCVLFVHGIGGYSNDDPKHIIDAFAKLPHTRQTAASHDVPVDGTAATLKRQDFVNDSTGHQLRCYTLTWEPVTTPLKTEFLGYDQDGSITSHRLPIDNSLRSSLMDAGIPDVILYEGQYKPAIQHAVKSALKRIHDDIESRADKENDYEYVFVTWSLGSKIVFDCLAEPNLSTTQPSGGPTTEPAGATTQPADDYVLNKIARKTHSVFMLANQLPLLTLGDVKSGDTPVPFKALRSVAKQRKDATVRTGTTTAATKTARPETGGPLWIVAFSDPNDLLSYPLPPQLIPPEEAGIANVSISIARTAYWIPFVGWIMNPDTAHTGYALNDDVVDLIIRGGKADAAK